MKRSILSLAGAICISTMALVTALVLTGCTQKNEDIGREITVAGLSFSVPDEWIVERHDDDESFGYLLIYSGDKSESMTVWYDDSGNFDPDSDMEITKDVYNGEFTYDLVSQTELDGNRCFRYSASMSGSDGGTYPATILYVDGEDYDYEISYYGDSLDGDDLLESLYLN